MNIGDWINSILAGATVLMAGGTFYLAYITQKLAKDTADGTKQAERHHQENMRPFCVIAFPNASEQQPFGFEFHSQSERPAAAIWVRGNVQNKGKGPAKDIFLYFNMRRGEGEGGAYRLTRPVVVSGLIGAEETLATDIAVTERDVMHTWDGARWKPTQVFSAIANDTYEIVLEYKDVFGNTFRTVHPRGIWTNPIPDIGDQEKRSEMLRRQDRPTPIFLTGRQAPRSPADLPSLPQALIPDEPPGLPEDR
jgi:hypothetical protein